MQVPQEKKNISWKLPAGISLAILIVLGISQIVIANLGTDNQLISTIKPTATPTVSAPAQVNEDQVVPTTAPDGKVNLTLNAIRGNSYIDVIVDGTRVIKGSLFQGDVKNFEGTKAISIYLSNPAGIDVTVDGQLLPPLGGQNEEVRRTFR
jgi:hypothetical protein